MSESHQQILALDVAPEDAEAVAERLRTWLRDRRFAVPDPDAVDDFPPNSRRGVLSLPADRLGPGFTVRPTEWDDPRHDPRWSFIYVHVPHDEDHRIWYLGDSTGPSDCRYCGTPFADEPFWAAFNAWLEGPEPTLTCADCGGTALMGDQDTSGSIVVSPLGIVTSDDGWDLVPELLGALRADFGGRWTWVHHHP
ncbi:hypothetical protein [Curtobacterium sp. 9128]|uniref:hypothetical protein n=1 Tax=Curtobacterium sp. 9128 TaxID=1793722 RepID=UPI0011A321E7|nr:hypothetical protein [Curtobacterium sp. 9128]